MDYTPSSKVTAVGAAGAAISLILFALRMIGYEVTLSAEQMSALVTVLVTAVGYIKWEHRGTNSPE